VAAQLERRAQAETDPTVKAEWHKIAVAYGRLAALANQNDKGGLLIE